MPNELQRLLVPTKGERHSRVVELSIAAMNRRMMVGADQHHVLSGVFATSTQPMDMMTLTQIRSVDSYGVPETDLAPPSVQALQLFH